MTIEVPKPKDEIATFIYAIDNVKHTDDLSCLALDFADKWRKLYQEIAEINELPSSGAATSDVKNDEYIVDGMPKRR